ncbi:MAG: hypothetical protein R2856_05770 [Caldilineaceae bacterium]
MIEREWQPGDRVEVDAALRRHRAGRRQRGRHHPRTAHLRYFQDAQSRSHDLPLAKRGLCEDVVLQLDPANPAITEEAVDGNLIGPALHVPALVKARAPIFSTAAGNAKLPPTETQTVRLLPFVNRRAVRGEYQFFVDYRK